MLSNQSRYSQESKAYNWKKALACFPLLLSFVLPLVLPFVQNARKYGWCLSPFSYVFTINSSNGAFAVYSLVILLFSDCHITYINGKSRQSSAIIGVLQVFAICAVYVILTAITCVLITIPVVEWQNEWGIGWQMHAYAEVLEHTLNVPVDISLLRSYSPLKAFLLSILLQWCATSLIAMIMTLINSITQNGFAVFIGVFICILNTSIYNMLPAKWLKISPISLATLTTYDAEAHYFGITFHYTFTFFSVGLLVSIFFYIIFHDLLLKYKQINMKM